MRALESSLLAEAGGKNPEIRRNGRSSQAELAVLPGATEAAAAARYVAISLPEAWAGTPQPTMRVVDAAAPLPLDLSSTAAPRRNALPYVYWLLAPIGKAGWPCSLNSECSVVTTGISPDDTPTAAKAPTEA